MSKIRVLIYRFDIHNLQTKTVSFPDQEKVLKEVVFSYAVSINAHTPNPKYFEVRNTCETKFRDFAISWQIRENLVPRNIWILEI